MKKKIMKCLKQQIKSIYMYSTIILGLFIILLGFSYAILETQFNKNDAISLLAASGPITVTSDVEGILAGISLLPNETISVRLDLTNNTSEDAIYRIIYKTSGSITAKYLDILDPISGTIGDQLSGANTKAVSLVLKNTGTTATTVSANAESLPMEYEFPALATNTYLILTTASEIEYAYSGNYQKFIAPKTGYYEIGAWGAQGGTASYSTWTYSGGKGGYVSGKVYLTQGEQLYVYVGGMGESISGTSTFTVLSNGNGYNGGGSGSSSSNNSAHSGGGGATDIRLVSGNWDNDASLNSRIMVAGGGGGSASHHTNGINYSGTGGDGGNLIGETAIYQPLYYYNYGVGGSQTEGGYSVAFKEEWDYTGTAGFGKGHIMTNSSATASGGGGYYGGGAGRHTSAGGGSSYISGYAGVAAIIEGSVTEPNRNHINSNELINTKHYSNKYFIDTQMQSGINNGNGKSTIKYLGTTAPTRINTELDGVRYVKDCVNRNSNNPISQWMEIQAIVGGSNVALNGTISGTSPAASMRSYDAIINGDVITSSADTNLGAASGTGNQCVIVDLGMEYDLDEIAVWHFWLGGRTYYENVTSVKGTSGSTYTTVLNNQYQETSEGNRISAYRAKPTQRTLTLNLNEGTTTYPTSYSIIEGDSVVLKDPTRDNYTFTGWTCAGTGCSTSTNVVSIGTTDATATAQWVGNSYAVTLDNQSATTAGTTSVAATYNSAMPAITIPTKTGYTFGGYYTQTGGGGTQYYTAGGASARTCDLTSTITLYAKWTPITYSIVINANGGSASGIPESYNVTSSAITLTTPTRPSYSFVGWTASDINTPQLVVTIPTGSVGHRSYTANWQQTVTEFNYVTTAAQPFVPSFPGVYKLEVWGAQGGSVSATYYGGQGGYATGNARLSTTVYVYVGGAGIGGTNVAAKAGGWNGGGSYTTLNGTDHVGASGGGATHIASTNRANLKAFASYTSEVYIVAGGGGGGYDHNTSGYCGAGGAGGGTTGGNSIQPSGCDKGGLGGVGGTQTAGGNYNGAFGQGGAPNYSWGSPGGGGWYGGGASNGSTRANGNTAGAGGSGYIGGVIAGTGSMTVGGRSGNGFARITYVGP